jgi:L-ascorbate metabolism protein UlaG (beta-lactamase superfamily)
MFRKIFLTSAILFIGFVLYVSTYYKSGINTLRPNPNNETISYRLIAEDLTHKKDYFTWIGQATILLNIDKKNILFDPIFSERASPLKNIGPKRNIPPAIAINSLPKIDLIVISHNHYDHLDLQSLKEIQNKYPLVNIFVPKGDLRLLKSIGLKNISEFEWWENQSIFNFSVTFVPTKHWSARGLFDRNKSLWGGWAIRSKSKTVLHIGDTAYADYFKDFPEKLGQIDITFMPIGSYYPRDIESEYHVDPYEAIQLARELESKYTYGIHWGGIFFTQEPTYEPQKIVAQEMSLDSSLNFHTSIPGIIINLP